MDQNSHPFQPTASTLIALLAVLFCCSAGYSQCMLIPLSLEYQSSHSHLIVEGTVVDKSAFMTANGDFIYTTYQVELTKIFKGQYQHDIVTIVEEGGQVGNRRIDVTPSIELRVGETGTFFLEQYQFKDARDGQRFTAVVYRAYASSQSIFNYDFQTKQAISHFHQFELDRWNEVMTTVTGVPYEKRKELSIPVSVTNRAVPSISSMSPLTITAGTFSILTINGDGFGASAGSSIVEFKNADNGGSTWFVASAPHIQSWSNTQIQLRLPYGAGNGQVRVTVGGMSVTSAQSLVIPYSQFNVTFNIYDPPVATVFKRHLYNNNGIGGYTFRYHSEINNNVPARKSLERALNSWRCNTEVNFTIGDVTTVDVQAFDGTNVIRFDNGAELPEGVGARCYTYLDDCVNVDIYVTHIMELDLIFNDAIPGVTWEYGPALPSATEVDFESIALHELGHGCSLGHVINPTAVLHFSINVGEHKRVLSADDINGGIYIQGQNTGNPAFCDNTPMTDYRQVKYVNIATTGIQSGDSWAQSYKYLQDALADVTTCIDTIYVAGGYYFPDEGAGMTNGDQTLKFTLNNPVVLMGGYSATSGVRNLATTPSILSGDIDQNNSSDAPNSQNVVRITAAAHLDGFYIENGHADGTTGTTMFGAGAFITANALLRNCMLRWNVAIGVPPTSFGRGGGVYQTGGASVFDNVLFHSNFAVANGTAIQLDGGTINCTNCTIASNSPNVVAVRLENGAHLFRNSIFWNNQSDLQIASGSANVSYSMLQSASLPGNATGTNVLFNTNPLFVNQGGFNFALTPCSPGVSTGNNAYNTTSIDLLGNARLVGTIDRGALENTTGTPATQVTNASDTGAGSLRTIIANACPGNTITFSNTLAADTIVLTGPQIVLDKNLVIDGLGLTQLYISANGTHRHFSHAAGITTTIKNMTLIEGNAATGNCISNAGNLTLQNIRLRKKTTAPNPHTISNASNGIITIANQVFVH